MHMYIHIHKQDVCGYKILELCAMLDYINGKGCPLDVLYTK
ncbi:hypothetical protein LEMLEM_LOCUS3707 [Lemmus lemmus]